jgi:hypothetical protein
MSGFIKIAEGGVLDALNKQVPPLMGPYTVTGKETKPYWNFVVQNDKGETFALDPQWLESQIGSFTMHLVSDFANPDPLKIGRFGVASIGTWSDETNSLFTFYERGGGGTGAIHYALHPVLGLLIGQQPAKRNRKHRLDGYEVPRGYDTKTVDGIRERYEASITAETESEEEAAWAESLMPYTITWADGAPFTTDQNGSVMAAGSGEGFKYQGVRWPLELLRNSEFEYVLEPDTDNPIVSFKGGDKEHGHTGELFFVPYKQLTNRKLLPGWSLEIAADGLGLTGAFALWQMLSREGINLG